LANARISDLLLENVPAAIALFDTGMRYIACSRRWLSDYGLEGQDVVGRSHYDVFPEIGERWRNIHRRALAGETLSSEAEAFVRADGSVDWIQWRIVPWRDESGEIGGVVLFTQVLTDAVESKRRTTTLDTELNLLIDSAKQHAICMLDADGRVRIWNTGAERLYGWSEKEVLGRYYAMMFEPGDQNADLPAHQMAIARREGVFQGRSKRIRKDGSRFIADVTLSRINDENGSCMGFGQVVRDVTQEAEDTRSREAAEAYLHSILNTVPDAMITIDDRGVILSFSAAAEQLFGYAAAEVVGRNVSMLMPEPDSSRHDTYLARYRATEERRIIGNMRRVLGRRKDGSVFPHELYVGEASGGGRRIFTGFLRDLTAREEADARLTELQAELIHISRVSAVGTMATALAHELNQPLTAIANYVQTSAAVVAREGEQALTMVHEALEEAGREAIRAGAIVQRLRDFVARGELERIVITPRDLALQARELGAAGAAAGGISCEVEVAQELEPVLVDRVQIQQVLLNLIRNAMEAMGEMGSIAIGANREGTMMRFSVIDTGPGIPPGKEEDLFEPFVSGKASGMGMGLAICRTIIEAHGGRMWCESVPEGGAAFHFTVPVAEVDHD
jgi:two-component system sensor kinase FixL